MGVAEALIPSGGWKTAHAPALLELPSGDMLCAWFAGSFEGSTDISIICARLPKDAGKWEAPVQVSRDPARSEQNPSLFLTPNGEVWMMYTAQLGRASGKDNMQYTSIIRRQRSTDGGRNWSEADVMFSREGSFCRQPIQVLSNGRWIFSNWLCSDSVSGLAGDPTVFQISDDSGVSWRTVEMPGSAGRVHANVVELENGYLAAFMRSREADFIYRSESHDSGDSWNGPIPTALPNNNSGISAFKLKSGRIAIAYNPTRSSHPVPGEAAWPGLRCPVTVALSEDGGFSFPLARNMEAGEGFTGTENSTNNRQYEYPYLMQAADGALHLAFAYRDRCGIKWMRFMEKDVIGAKRESAGIYNPTSVTYGTGI
jgi:predicted neuraminidase